ncbi:hypothetical protein Prudu_006077 [Prunus dulcis]|uniref:Ankyrin repeat family protein n=1 Tax=Prunus dulcis TaxID=3755 RepID=A0A4Y1QZ14_PRUDU|nr:hypothetical protein Prudu_006077 [Prunus dulcis]
MVIRRIVDRSPGYSELANPRSRILIKLYGGDDYAEFGAPGSADICCHCQHLLHCASTDGPLGSWSRGSQALLHQLHQWHSLLAPGGVIGPPAPPTPHPLMRRGHSQLNFQEEHRGPCRQLKTAKVTRVTNSRINIGYDERHRAAPTAELHSSLAHDIGHVIRSHCPMKWKSWKVMPDETKTEVRGQLSTNYNLEDLDDESLAYVNRLFSERYKQWKSDLHHILRRLMIRKSLFRGLPEGLRGGRINKAKVNKGNRKKKTLLHHSGSRPFSYRMDARRQGGPNSQRSTSLATFMFDLGMSWPNDDGGEEPVELVLQESASQLPPDTPIESVDPPQDAGFQILTETLDQTLGRRPGTYCRGMGNARRREPRPRSSAQSNSQVTALTAQVATLQSQMSVILQSLAQSDIPVPHFDAPTSEPVHPEHPHQTTALYTPDL